MTIIVKYSWLVKKSKFFIHIFGMMPGEYNGYGRKKE
jgi:hypothetical protein